MLYTRPMEERERLARRPPLGRSQAMGVGVIFSGAETRRFQAQQLRPLLRMTTETIECRYPYRPSKRGLCGGVVHVALCCRC